MRIRRLRRSRAREELTTAPGSHTLFTHDRSTRRAARPRPLSRYGVRTIFGSAVADGRLEPERTLNGAASAFLPAVSCADRRKSSWLDIGHAVLDRFPWAALAGSSGEFQALRFVFVEG